MVYSKSSGDGKSKIVTFSLLFTHILTKLFTYFRFLNGQYLLNYYNKTHYSSYVDPGRIYLLTCKFLSKSETFDIYVDLTNTESAS